MNMADSTIDNGDGPTHATVFIWVFAVSAIWHYTSSAGEIMNYWFRYDPLVTPLVFLSIATAFIAACYPHRTAALMLMSCAQLLTIALRFPFVADHLVMELFLNVAIVLSFCYLAIKRRTLKISTTDLFQLFGPVGRWLLIVMYFFGTFHKLNPGFMSLASSCAISFLDGFPIPEGLREQAWLQYAAIYGTLIVEAAAMLLLFSARTKYFGMLLGMSFHFVVGISGYGTLAHFSAFAMALHILFVPSGFGARLCKEPLIPQFLKSPVNFKAATVLLIVLQVLFALHMATTREGYLVNTLFAVFAVTLMFLVFKHGQIQRGDAAYRLKARPMFLNVVPVLYFVHCLGPYIGLGSAGALSMFSGLRTEGGISNHYIIRRPIPLFPYQDKVIYIEKATNSSMQAAADGNQGVVLFDFQRHITYRETLIGPIRLRIENIRYDIQDSDALLAFAEEHFVEQNWFERKYMLFRLVDDPFPKRCRH